MTMLHSTFTDKIESRLKFIYKDRYSQNTLEALQTVIQKWSRKEGNEEKWNEQDIILITYGDSIKTSEEVPLQTLKNFLDDQLQDELSIVHILPFFPFSSDDGFSVIDFREVNPELGNWQDISGLHENFDLMMDLVINHASSKGEWFANFLRQEGRGMDYFICEDPEKDLSLVTRPRSTPLLTPYQTKAGEKHVWTTFSADQVDLDFSNPDLLIEIIDILLLYITQHARVIRLDAIAFLWKKIGTTCLHLPETHEVVKLMRDIAEHIDPSVVILTETNVPNKENLSYFGDNDEAHMVYQFSLPPLLLHALHTGKEEYLISWAKSLPQLKGQKTFFNFTASHDGIGVRPLEGLLPEPEKTLLVENMKKFGGFVNYKSNTDGTTSPYELNITYFDALKGTQDGIDEFQVKRFLASQVVMMSFAGVPAFYIHSLTATPNYLEGVKQTGHNRTINRRKWELNELQDQLKHDPVRSKVFQSLKQLIGIRKNQSAFHPNASMQMVDCGEGIFSCIRESSNKERIWVVVNLTSKTRYYQPVQKLENLQYDLISRTHLADNKLGPYQCLWLVF